MSHYKVLKDSWTEQIRSPQEDDNWDRGDTHTSYSINGFEVVGENDHFDDVTRFDPEHDKPYYLLYVLYGTGDTFGQDGGQIQFIGLFEQEKIAELNQTRIEDHKDDFSMQLFMEDGNRLIKYEISVSWVGYFEHLESVNIETVYRK